MKKVLYFFVATLIFVLVAGCQSGEIVPTRIPLSVVKIHFKEACDQATKSFFVLPENDVYILAASGVCQDDLVWYYQNNIFGKNWPGPEQLPGGASAAGAMALMIAEDWEKAGWTVYPSNAVKCLMKAFQEERLSLERDLVITPSP
jgi:hypothetical protein